MTSLVQPARPRPIDPLAPSPGGAAHRYEDDVVVVEKDPLGRRRPSRHPVRTAHFDLGRAAGRLQVVHDLAPGDLDDDLAGLLTAELFGPGWVSGADAFERIFTGIVRSSRPDPLGAWELFYRNTLRRLGDPQTPAYAPAHTPHTTAYTLERADGSIAAYRPVYERALELVPGGAVLDLGSCFGFLPLQLAGRGDTEVLASDVAAGTMALLSAISGRLLRPVRTLVADAARIPLPAGSADTVTALHLLEHLDPVHGEAVLHEAYRLARRRVVVAVPFEEHANCAYGHQRTFDLTAMRAMAAAVPPSWHAEVGEHHGGWLVADRTE
jgi:hypothetical protein